MRVHFMVIGQNDHGDPDPEAELDVLPRAGETVLLPGGLDLTVQSVAHHPLGDSQTPTPYAVVVVG